MILPDGRLDQLEDRPCQRGLAAAGLADEAECLALPHVEIDAVDGVHLPDRALEEALADREVLDEILDAKDLVARRCAERGRGWRRVAATSLTRPLPQPSRDL